MADEEPVIIAYDGECMMCSRGIRFLAEKDRRHRLRFVPLQSPLGQAMEKQAREGSLSTVIVKKRGQVFTYSDGILHILRTLGGRWLVPGVLGMVVPRWLRDKLYRYIAQHRYRWFGKADVCSLPSEAIRERLIDGDRV
jgi:predicted DCC family thiol-disulfide oxidoreductase YuxK